MLFVTCHTINFIEARAGKISNSGPSENLHFIIKVIKEKGSFQSRMGSRFTGAPALIIKLGLVLGLLNCLSGPELRTKKT